MAILSSYQRVRTLILTASIACFLVFWFAGRMFGIPAHAGYEASLLQQPSPVMTILVVAIVLAACALFGTAVAGSVSFEAGLLAASLGLSALSFRGGSSRYVVFRALEQGGVPAIFLKLAVEMALLAILIGLVWFSLRKLLARPNAVGTALAPTAGIEPDADELLATGLQVAVTALGVLLLGRSEAKLQVMSAVFLGSLAGPLGAHFIRPVRPQTWYWLPPLLVGLVAYILAYLNPAGAANADLQGGLAALSRPLPLDYASAGVAGAIFGHWMAHGWQQEKDNAGAAALAA